MFFRALFQGWEVKDSWMSSFTFGRFSMQRILSRNVICNLLFVSDSFRGSEHHYVVHHCPFLLCLFNPFVFFILALFSFLSLVPYQPNPCVHAGLFNAGQEKILYLLDSSQEQEHLDVPCQTGVPTGLQRPLYWPAESQRFSWHFSSASAIHREVLPVFYSIMLRTNRNFEPCSRISRLL